MAASCRAAVGRATRRWPQGCVGGQYSSGRKKVIVIWNYLLARRFNPFAPPGCTRIGHSAASEPESRASSRCTCSELERRLQLQPFLRRLKESPAEDEERRRALRSTCQYQVVRTSGISSMPCDADRPPKQD